MYRPFTPFPKPLYPVTDLESGRRECLEDYKSRIRSAFPGLPVQVAKQVFYDHGHYIDRHSWLDFRILAFRSELWDVENFESTGIFQKETIQYFSTDRGRKIVTERKLRIDDYFLRNRTWPLAPVLLKLSDTLGVIPEWEEPCDSWLLIDGAYRMGTLVRLKRKGLAQRHAVWICEMTNKY